MGPNFFTREFSFPRTFNCFTVSNCILSYFCRQRQYVGSEKSSSLQKFEAFFPLPNSTSALRSFETIWLTERHFCFN